MKKLKVLFVTVLFPSEKNPVEGIFIREHAKAVGLFNDVAVLYLSPGPIKDSPISIGTEDGLRVIRAFYCRKRKITGKDGFQIINKSLMSEIFARISGEVFLPDILHAHFYYAGSTALALGDLMNAPVIISEHASDFIRKTLSKKDAEIARFIFAKAAGVFPVSRALAKAIRRYKLDNIFDVVGNTVDTDIFLPPLPGKDKNTSKRYCL